MYVCTPDVQRSFNSTPNSQRLPSPSSHSKRTRHWPDTGLFMSNYQYSFLHSACLDQLRKESLSGYLQTAWFLYHIHTFTAADAIKQGIEKWGIRKIVKILKGRLDLIPSPSLSVQIQIMGGKVCLKSKGKTFLVLVNKPFKNKKFVDIIQQCFALSTQGNFPTHNLNLH